ncbi:hypothetical protein DM02DRAFT_663810 [Periconia macrospinosa]|uniref:Uncharacterized protein n=1 Tax=Periconia macrospinosa TaxID=97972 RepID=A0A2V1D0N2_9PLEO|nr:hypothetical protein DM02DRAFT_663810 [Periconia macrospinosa]
MNPDASFRACLDPADPPPSKKRRPNLHIQPPRLPSQPIPQLFPAPHWPSSEFTFSPFGRGKHQSPKQRWPAWPGETVQPENGLLTIDPRFLDFCQTSVTSSYTWTAGGSVPTLQSSSSATETWHRDNRKIAQVLQQAIDRLERKMIAAFKELREALDS